MRDNLWTAWIHGDTNDDVTLGASNYSTILQLFIILKLDLKKKEHEISSLLNCLNFILENFHIYQ